MNIINKLELSKQPIVMFKEGKFLKLYNQSLYTANCFFNTNLKIVPRYVKQIDQTVICGGFPISSLNKRFPQAITTSFGYQFNCKNYDLSAYYNWYQYYNQQTKSKSYHLELDSKLSILDQQQIDFLTKWQPEIHQQFDHIAFINSIKKTFQL